jgi:hypothetical protein
MTVSELIKQLSELDPESQVMIDHTDHTDWRYTIELNTISVGTPEYCEDENDDLFDDDCEYIGKPVVLLHLDL